MSIRRERAELSQAVREGNADEDEVVTSMILVSKGGAKS